MPAAGPESSGPAAAAAEASLQHWLDALAGRGCTQDEFVAEILRREPADPEVVWEVLALLDQYFRRKRIDQDTYACLKARFQQHSLGTGVDSSPAPRPAARIRDNAGAPRTFSSLSDNAADPAFTMPWVDAPDDEPALEQDAGALPELVEASFHREVRTGDVLCGRYRVVELLRQEDWTTFVEAIDESKLDLPGIRQRVMLQLVDESRSMDPVLVQRVGKLQGLSHPGITRVLDVGEECGVLVVVQEFYSGATVRDVLEQGGESRMTPQSSLGIVRSLASALSYAHARGVAHGDVSTANVLITDSGDVRLQGFELRAQNNNVQPAADRQAFARLSYQLLAGVQDAAAGSRIATSRLRQPAGITRAQWRALRVELEGRESQPGADVLQAFADAPLAFSNPLPALVSGGPTPPTVRRRSHVGEWIAAGIVAAILGTGGYFYVGARQDPASPPVTSETATAATSISPPALPDERPAAPAAAIPAPEQQVKTVVAATTDSRPATPRPAPVRATTAPEPRPDVAAGIRPSIDLAANFAWVDTSARVARIWVMRRGNPNSEVTFRWWTETGTALVDRDFRRIDPRVEIIPYGARGIELLVPLMPDPARREPRTFYVKIDEPGLGADLGARTLMQVAIVPPGYPAARDTTALNLNAP